MLILALIIYAVLPLLSFPLIFSLYYKDPSRTVIYSLLLAITIGIVSYHFNPPFSFDLYRHHQVIDSMKNVSVDQFLGLIKSSYEPAALLISYLVATTRNTSLLQFSMVTVGYWILLYILKDYANNNKIRPHAFLLVTLFTLSSFTLVNFMSGIWNYIAMIIFALAFYLESKPKHNKIIVYTLYLIAPLLHSSMFLPLGLLIVFKLCGERLNTRLALLLGGIVLSLPLIHPVVSSISGIAIFSQLEPMYQSYFASGPKYYNLYGGNVLVMELMKLSIYITIAMIMRKNASAVIQRSIGYVLLLTATILTYAPISIVTLRFVILVQFTGFAILMEYMSSRKTLARSLLICIMISLVALFSLYQYYTLKNLDYGGLLTYRTLDNVARVFLRGPQ